MSTEGSSEPAGLEGSLELLSECSGAEGISALNRHTSNQRNIRDHSSHFLLFGFNVFAVILLKKRNRSDNYIITLQAMNLQDLISE